MINQADKAPNQPVRRLTFGRRRMLLMDSRLAKRRAKETRLGCCSVPVARPLVAPLLAPPSASLALLCMQLTRNASNKNYGHTTTTTKTTPAFASALGETGSLHCFNSNTASPFHSLTLSLRNSTMCSCAASLYVWPNPLLHLSHSAWHLGRVPAELRPNVQTSKTENGKQNFGIMAVLNTSEPACLCLCVCARAHWPNEPTTSTSTTTAAR